jgi:hypothetical protein
MKVYVILHDDKGFQDEVFGSLSSAIKYYKEHCECFGDILEFEPVERKGHEKYVVVNNRIGPGKDDKGAVAYIYSLDVLN